jgi:UDP-perosamine 4-acetyltransferase
MTRPLVVLGGGGHARVVIDALQAGNRQILGVVDPKLSLGGAGPLGVAVLGGDEALERYPPGEVLLVNGIGGIGSTERRNALYERFRALAYQFACIVHPSAIVSRHAKLGEGVHVMAGCVVQCGVAIGANTIVNTRASVDHDCVIGRSVHIAPGVTLSGSVTVGNESHIGTGAAVIQGITVGRNCLIAAGAVVHRDLADGERLIKVR